MSCREINYFKGFSSIFPQKIAKGGNIFPQLYAKTEIFHTHFRNFLKFQKLWLVKLASIHILRWKFFRDFRDSQNIPTPIREPLYTGKHLYKVEIK